MKGFNIVLLQHRLVATSLHQINLYMCPSQVLKFLAFELLSSSSFVISTTNQTNLSDAPSYLRFIISMQMIQSV